MTKRNLSSSIAAIGVSVLLTACASSPPENPKVTEARNSYQAIQNDPNVVRSAAADLRQAQEHLRLAEELLEEGADDNLIEHEAYLADQYAAVAEAKGQRSAIQQEIETAEERRRELRLQTQASATQQAQSEADALRQQLQELKEMQAKQTDRGMVLTLGDVLFDLNKATLQRPAQASIDRLAAFLKEYPERRVRAEGYTDSTGSEEYNQQLSEDRARSVKQALVDQGVAPERVEVTGFGEAYPVASNEDAAGRARNRRVEIVISDEDGTIGTR